MTEKEKFISEKMRKLVGEEKYSRPQAYAIAMSYWNRKQQGGTVTDSAGKMFQANIGDTGLSSKYANYGSEIINPVTLVQKVGDEGYNVYYGDPNDPNADKVFFTTDEFNQKKNFISYPNNPSYNKEPYLQAYLNKTQGRVGIPIKSQQGGQAPSKAEQFLGNNYAIQTAYEEVPTGTEAQAILAMEQMSKAPQKKIQRILPNVQTSETKQGLPEGTYTRVDYADNTFDYLTPSGYENLRRMNNYRLFMEGQRRQQGGEYYAQMGAIMSPPYQLPTNGWNPNATLDNMITASTLPPTPTFNTRNEDDINQLLTDYQAPQQTQQDIIKQGQQITESTLPSEKQVTDAQKTLRQDNIKYNDVNRVNILNPYGGVSLDYALNYAGRGFGTGNPWQAGIGTGLSLLKGTRNFLTGFSEGKETKRVAQEMMDKQFDNSRNYIWAQQGGKIKNSEVIAQNAITDNPQGNVNTEGGEYVMRNYGMIQPIVGEPHIKNGKIADGVNVQLNEGDKVLSDYVKLKPSDIKELKERYNVSLKKGATFAQAQKKLDQKLGIKKLEDEKAVLLEKAEKAATIKDENSRELSLNALTKSIGTVNEKINTLSGVREDNFNFLFERQESQEKIGDGSQLFDKNGKEVTEVAQEGKDKDDYYQEGGMYIQQLAKKYNIPLERAMELIKMQEGGEQVPQEQAQDQMVQMIVEALQQGASPDEIINSLVQQGIPQEQAMGIVEQIAMEMQGGQNAPQEEQVQYAQQGRIGSKYEDPNLFKKQTPTGEGWESFGELLKDKPKEVLAEIKRVHPELYATYFKDDKINKGNIAEYQRAVNKKYENILQDAEKVYGKDSERLVQLKNQIEQDKFTDITPEYSERVDGNVNTNIRGLDAMLGNYTSTRPNFVLDVLPEEELKKVNEAGVNTASQLKSKFPDLYKQYVGDKKLTSDFWLGKIQPEKSGVPAQETVEQTTTETQPTVQTRDRVKNIMPNFEPYIPMISALQPIAKQNVDFQRIAPIKQTVEPMLAEQARQYQTEVDRIEQTGMSPQQQEAILAQGLASGQMAANDAISRVETFNAQNQFQTDQYNAGLQAKEQVMNAQMNDAYQDKMMASLANQEESIRNQYRTQFLQGQADRNYITNLNKINTLSNQFAITPNGVEYLNNNSYSVPTNTALNAELENMTPEQREAYKAQVNAQEIARKRQAYAQMGLKR